MLTWIEDRWHADGKPIYAGSTWRLKCPMGWLVVRVESASRGHILIGYTELMGRDFTTNISEADILKPM